MYRKVPPWIEELVKSGAGAIARCVHVQSSGVRMSRAAMGVSQKHLPGLLVFMANTRGDAYVERSKRSRGRSVLLEIDCGDFLAVAEHLIAHKKIDARTAQVLRRIRLGGKNTVPLIYALVEKWGPDCVYSLSSVVDLAERLGLSLASRTSWGESTWDLIERFHGSLAADAAVVDSLCDAREAPPDLPPYAPLGVTPTDAPRCVVCLADWGDASAGWVHDCMVKDGEVLRAVCTECAPHIVESAKCPLCRGGL